MPYTSGIHIRRAHKAYTHLHFVKPLRVAFVKFVGVLVVAKALLFLIPGKCRHDVHEDLRLRFSFRFRLGSRCGLDLVLGRRPRGVHAEMRLKFRMSL